MSVSSASEISRLPRGGVFAEPGDERVRGVGTVPPLAALGLYERVLADLVRVHDAGGAQIGRAHV